MTVSERADSASAAHSPAIPPQHPFFEKTVLRPTNIIVATHGPKWAAQRLRERLATLEDLMRLAASGDAKALNFLREENVMSYDLDEWTQFLVRRIDELEMGVS
jgi:hypothetical protein